MLLLHMLFFSIFYPHCYGDHLHLPSFPTRRSSDLSYYVRAWVAAAIVLVQTAVIAASFALDPPVNGTEMIVMVARSEEHTSELQSRGHLVCRLLLEKKK